MQSVTINLAEAFTKVVDSGAIQQAIENAIQKTVVEAVKSELREYSDFGKAVTEAVRKALAIHGEIDLPSYNDTILTIIASQVEGLTKRAIESQVADRMKELLTPAPERISLLKFVEQYVESLKRDSDAGCTCYGEDRAYVHLEERDNQFSRLTLAKSSKVEYGRRDGEISIGLYVPHGRKEAEIYTLAFQNQEVEKGAFSGPFYGFEKSVFQMRAAKTKIEIDGDPSEVDTYYGPAYAD